MKEIVIKMPEKVYKSIINGKNYISYQEYVEESIKNGKALPEGHTELIDTRILIQDFCMASSAMKNNGEAPVFDLHEITNLILAQDVLVEADKGEE